MDQSDLRETIASALICDANRWPDRHGDYHADCPYCRKPTKKGQTHFRISSDGLCYCQVCRAGTTLRALADHLGITPPKQNGTSPQTEYNYYDANGLLAYQVVRYIKQGKKSFFQRHLLPSGAWQNGINGIDRVLYRLPDVMQAIKKGTPIYIVEGEKDVETLRMRGMVATTNVGGAGKWLPSYNESLRGATVYILPDNDPPGEKHAQEVKQNLQGIAQSARIVRLPGLADKQDVSDWLASGHTIEDLRSLVDNAQVQQLQQPSPKRVIELIVDWRQQGITLRELQHKHFDPEKWIIERILPEGACLLAAKYKSYKSWLCLGLGLAISMGGKAIGQLEVTQGRVLYLDLEGKQQRIKKRTRAILGVQHIDWPDNFHVFTKWPQGSEGMKELENWFSSYPDTSYVIIDVLGDFRRPIDKHEMGYQYDRDTVQPINELAERYHAAIHLVHHFNKLKNIAGDIMDSISGTTGLPSAVNTMWGMSKDPNDSKITILSLRGRDLENDEPLALRWDDYLNLHVIEGPAREVSIGAERKAIMELLSDDIARSPKEIAGELSRSVDNVKQLLRKLLTDGLIEKPIYGKYARVVTDHADHADHGDTSDHADHSGASALHIVKNEGKDAHLLHQSDRKIQRVIGDISTDHSSVRHQEASNGKSDRGDRHIEGDDFSIDCVSIGDRVAWRLWHDPSNRMLGEFASEQKAKNAITDFLDK